MSFLLDLTPLRTSPAFRRLWWGLGISNFGTQLTVVAVGLQVYAITRSTLAVGVLGVCARWCRWSCSACTAARWSTRTTGGRWRWSSSSGCGWSRSCWPCRPGCTSTRCCCCTAWWRCSRPGSRSTTRPGRRSSPGWSPRSCCRRPTCCRPSPGTSPSPSGRCSARSWSPAWDFAAAYTIDVVLFTAALWALWRLPDLPPVASRRPTRRDGAGREARAAPRCWRGCATWPPGPTSG